MLEGLYSQLQLTNGKCYANIRIYRKNDSLYYFDVREEAIAKEKTIIYFNLNVVLFAEMVEKAR